MLFVDTAKGDVVILGTSREENCSFVGPLLWNRAITAVPYSKTPMVLADTSPIGGPRERFG